MKIKKLTPFTLAVENLKGRRFRSTCLTLLVLLLGFVLFAGAILSSSLTKGARSLTGRLGADILIVAEGYEQKVQGALLRGEPTTLTLPEEWIDRIAGEQGIASISSQLFIASFSSECCSLPLQVIGFDPGTDFVIEPWVEQALPEGIKSGEIIVGSSINADSGEVLEFFGTDYRVTARLEKTGMGFDTSVFMDLATARKALVDYEAKGGQFAPEGKNRVSAIMVDVKGDYNTQAVAQRLQETYGKSGIEVVVTQGMISTLSGGLHTLLVFIKALAGILWVLTIFVLALVFSVTLNERMREFGVLSALGAPKTTLKSLFVWEAALVSLAGSVAGILLAGLALLPFSTLMGLTFKMPYIQPSFGTVLALAGGSFLSAVLVGPLAALLTVRRLGKVSPYDVFKENVA